MLDQLILGLHVATYHHEQVERPVTHCATQEMQSHSGSGRNRMGHSCWTSVEKVKLNGDTPGVYVRHADTGLGAGVVMNSYDKWSFHADWTVELHRNLDFTVGGVTGYEKAEVLPVFAPSVKFRIPQTPLQARVTYLYGANTDALHLSIEALTWK